MLCAAAAAEVKLRHCQRGRRRRFVFKTLTGQSRRVICAESLVLSEAYRYTQTCTRCQVRHGGRFRGKPCAWHTQTQHDSSVPIT